MTQVVKPSPSDGEKLSFELSNQFPEVPQNVIQDIMEKNSNNHQLCIEALSRECHKFQHHLYGAPEIEQNLPEKQMFAIEDYANVSGNVSSSSKCPEHQGIPCSSNQPNQKTKGIFDRPYVYPTPFPLYNPPGVSSEYDGGMNQQALHPEQCAFGASIPVFSYMPFVQSSNPAYAEQVYAAFIKGASSATGTEGFLPGSLVDQAQNNYLDMSYASMQPFHSPYAKSNLLGHQVLTPTRGESRSPLPLLGQHPVESAVPFPGVGSLECSDVFNKGNHLPPIVSSSVSSVGLPFLSQQSIFVGSRLQPTYFHSRSWENLASGSDVTAPAVNPPPVLEAQLSSNSSCQPGIQMGGPGSSRSSRSSSLASEDLAYIQALLDYQKNRLEASLAALNQERETLDVLRSEISKLEKKSVERRLLRSETFPTAADRQKLISENQNLQIEIRLLTYEIDLENNGQTRLGWLESEDQRFHDVIPHGQSNHNYTSSSISELHQSTSSPIIPGSSSKAQISTGDARVLPLRPTRPAPPTPKVKEPDYGENWSCSACTFLNHPLLNKCECCEMPKVPATPLALR